MISITETEAFNVRTAQRQNGCVEWIGPRHPNGYGRFTYKRKQRLAHRAAYLLFTGPLKSDECVLHKCDNPSCVNPHHLFLGDRGDNARDMANKGRQWVQKNPAGRPICPIELRPRGSRHGMSKLQEADVLSIRRRAYLGELQKHLAVEFSVAKTLVNQIVNGHIWRHVGGPIKKTLVKEKS